MVEGYHALDRCGDGVVRWFVRIPIFELHHHPDEPGFLLNRENGLEGGRSTGVAQVAGVVEARDMQVQLGPRPRTVSRLCRAGWRR